MEEIPNLINIFLKWFDDSDSGGLWYSIQFYILYTLFYLLPRKLPRWRFKNKLFFMPAKFHFIGVMMIWTNVLKCIRWNFKATFYTCVKLVSFIIFFFIYIFYFLTGLLKSKSAWRWHEVHFLFSALLSSFLILIGQ